MPPRVDSYKCNGCEGLPEAKCEEICPGDLMVVDEVTMKAYCRVTKDCWDCMSCVKVCPKNAIETKIPYQLGYYRATLKPFVGHNNIIWKCTDIYGNEKRYKFRTRMDR